MDGQPHTAHLPLAIVRDTTQGSLVVRQVVTEAAAMARARVMVTEMKAAAITAQVTVVVIMAAALVMIMAMVTVAVAQVAYRASQQGLA